MPTAPPRLCPSCGLRLTAGQVCRACRPAWQKRRATTSRALDLSWPALRRKVLDRDGGRCRLCGQRATHVDHIIPRSQGGRDYLANLRSLCDYCHSTVTGRQGRAARDQTRY